MATQGFIDHEGERVAWRRVEGAGPTVVWLGGFHSDMTGTKAQALADWAQARGRGYLRFDYFGHGASSGAAASGTISRWLGDARLVVDELTEGGLVLVGSSMGAWLACLLQRQRPERIQGLALIAPAVDFTERLIRPRLPAEAARALETEGVWMRPSTYGEPQPITRDLLEDGANWLIMGGRSWPIAAPVRILQGEADSDVPWRHALDFYASLASSDVIFTLVRDGDHRLSRPQDIQRLIATVEELCDLASRASPS